MEYQYCVGTVVRKSKRRGSYFIDLPRTIAETFKPEGIALYKEKTGTLIGYSDIWYHKLAWKLKRLMKKFPDTWEDELFERPDCYDLFINNATEPFPIESRQRVWLPKKFVPNGGGAVRVSILDKHRFSIEFLV